MAAITVEELLQLKVGSVISYALGSDSVNAETNPNAEGSTLEFNALARVSELNHATNTESDEFTAFWGSSKAFVKETNEAVDNDVFTATCREYTAFMQQLKTRSGAPDANGERKLFTSDEPATNVWLKVDKFHNGALAETWYMWGKIRIEGDITENNKYIRPQINFEVEPSEHNKIVDAPAPTP